MLPIFYWCCISGTPSGTVSHIQMSAVHLYVTGVLFVLHSLTHPACRVPVPSSTLHISLDSPSFLLSQRIVLIGSNEHFHVYAEQLYVSIVPCISALTNIKTLHFLFPCTRCLPTCHTSHTQLIYFLCCPSIHVLFCSARQLHQGSHLCMTFSLHLSSRFLSQFLPFFSVAASSLHLGADMSLDQVMLSTCALVWTDMSLDGGMSLLAHSRYRYS